jgi:hypothetical protein
LHGCAPRCGIGTDMPNYAFMKTAIIILAGTMLVFRSSAQLFAPTLEIQLSSTNTAKVTANSVSHLDSYVVLQTTTDLADTNWVSLQTNLYSGVGAVVFTNLPATKVSEYFRVKAY